MASKTNLALKVNLWGNLIIAISTIFYVLILGTLKSKAVPDTVIRMTHIGYILLFSIGYNMKRRATKKLRALIKSSFVFRHLAGYYMKRSQALGKTILASISLSFSSQALKIYCDTKRMRPGVVVINCLRLSSSMMSLQPWKGFSSSSSFSVANFTSKASNSLLRLIKFSR